MTFILPVNIPEHSKTTWFQLFYYTYKSPHKSKAMKRIYNLGKLCDTHHLHIGDVLQDMIKEEKQNEEKSRQ